jgi:hypothetical protein
MPKKTNLDKGELLALALAGGDSVVRWAKANEMDVRAAYRLAARPEVRARAAELRGEMIDQAVGLLSKAATTAAATIWTIASDPAEPAMVRLNAARAVLANLIAVQTHAQAAEFDRRLAVLERSISEDGASDE